MARGWESKAVEDQIAQSANEKRDRAKAPLSPHRAGKRASGAPLTPAEVGRQTQREGLLLSRSRTLASLQGTCDARYRALLERTLAHVDEELARLDRETGL